MRLLRASILSLGLVGCASGLGWYDLVRDPRLANADLRRVHLKGETKGEMASPLAPGLESKGLVSGSYYQSRGGHTSQQACNSLMEEAITGLLLKAEKLGANSVRELETRGARQWFARLSCRVRPGDYPLADPIANVTVRGVAVYDPAIEASGPAASQPKLPKLPKYIEYERFLKECLSGESTLPKPGKPTKSGAKRNRICADLKECLSGYNMSLRPEAKRNEMCAENLRRKHEDFDAVMGAQ